MKLTRMVAGGLLVASALGIGHSGVASMVAVLANPNEYVNKTIAVYGYLFIDRVFLTKDHAEIGDYSSSIAIDDPDGSIRAKCGGQYVRIGGQLHEPYPDVLLLTDIENVSGPKDYCWRRAAGNRKSEDSN
jgi:hypothetical protein